MIVINCLYFSIIFENCLTKENFNDIIILIYFWEEREFAVIDVLYLWNAIYGNELLKKRLIADISQNKLAHAYIIEGPDRSGKLMLARTVAAAMSDSESDVRKIMSSQSPDVIELDLPEKRKTIGVETVREIKSSAYIKPNDLEFKCYIINHAEALTVQAQNAMLKLIEEPPRGVYFFLLCENVTALLTTIRSRAPILRMQLFSTEELTELLLEYSAEAQRLKRKNPQAFDAITRSAGGAYGEALVRIANEEKEDTEVLDDATALLTAISLRDMTKLLRVLQSLSGDREAFRKTLDKARLLVRDVIAYRICSDSGEYLFDRVNLLEDFSEQLSLDKLLKIDQVLASFSKDFVANPNVQNIKIQLYVKLSAI